MTIQIMISVCKRNHLDHDLEPIAGMGEAIISLQPCDKVFEGDKQITENMSKTK